MCPPGGWDPGRESFEGMIDAAGRRRVVIDRVRPEIDGGRFAIKRTVGEVVTVDADVFTDGHDALGCLLLHRDERAVAWTETAMEALGNDRYRASFTATAAGRWRYTVTAWVDRFKTWRRDLRKRLDAGQDVALDLLAGAALIHQAAERARAAGRRSDARVLAGLGRGLEQGRDPREKTARLALALDDELAQLMDRHTDRAQAATHRELAVVVDRVRARFSSWYEMFPRSCSPVPGRHGTFRDLAARLPDVAAMGFDVLYLPPIHPIGVTHRKGKNNAATAAPDDVGSPWAIGGAAGGHKAILPELGTAADFRRLIAKARDHGLELAMDIAFQCSPDHPYVREHPEWFQKRPDGTIQYAENPPKKYEDIYPFDFECEAWRELWLELKSVFDHWLERRRPHLPRRQPAHQAVRLLGVADRRDQARPSRRHLPGRGVHPPEADVPAGQARLHPVLQLFPLAHQRLGADRVLHRADPHRGRRVLPAQPVAEHAGHPHRAPAVRRPRGVPAALHPGGDARARATASTGRRSSCSRTGRASAAARSTSIRRNTSCATGTSAPRTACAT